MKKPQAIPMFGDAYLADTTHLSTEEHGAYFLLILAAWRQDDCSLPNDDRKLARIAGLSSRRWAKIKPVILEFWREENGRLIQARLMKEWHYVRQKSEQNARAAAQRWDKQPTDLFESDACERLCETDAPPPPPLSPTYPSDTSERGVKAKRASQIADNFEPILTDRAKRIVAKWPPGMFDRELAKFRDHHTAKGSLMKDWQAALRTWISNADEWSNRNVQRSRDTSSNGLFDACAEYASGAHPDEYGG